MESKVTQELLISEFQSDRLFQTIRLDNQLKDKLFPPFIDDLIIDQQYSTREVALLFSEYFEKANDNNIRYYMRSDNLESYIEPLQVGRNYQLFYKSIYKLFLVFLYLTVPGRNLNSIRSILPDLYDVTSFVKGKKHKENSDGEDFKLSEQYLEPALLLLQKNHSDIVGLGKHTHDLWVAYIENIQLEKALDSNHDLLMQKKDLLLAESIKLQDLKREISNTKNVLRDEAQFNNIRLMYKEVKDMKDEKSSFLGRLFPKKRDSTEAEFNKVTGEEKEIQSLKEKISEQENIVVKVKEEIESIQLERTKILEKKQDCKESLNGLSNFIETIDKQTELFSNDMLLSFAQHQDLDSTEIEIVNKDKNSVPKNSIIIDHK